MAHPRLRVKDSDPKIDTNDAFDNVGGFAFADRKVVVSIQSIP
jgi:hypothetical protein